MAPLHKLYVRLPSAERPDVLCVPKKLTRYNFILANNVLRIHDGHISHVAESSVR